MLLLSIGLCAYYLGKRSEPHTDVFNRDLMSYCKTGNVNEQVILTNLTSGMGSLIFLPHQQL